MRYKLTKGSHSIQPEKSLITRLQKGDHSAFAEIYDQYFDRLYYFVIRYLQSREESEGMVHEVFAKLWEIRAELKPEKSFNSFLFTMAKNAVFNKLNRRKHEIAYAEYMRRFLDQKYNKTENDLIFAEVKKRIETVVSAMPEQRQKSFRLSRENGLTYKEIAQEMNLSPKTVEAHIRLALKTLRKHLDPETLALIAALFPSFWY